MRLWLDDDHTGLRDYPRYRCGMRSDPTFSPLRRVVRRVWAAVGRALAGVFAHGVRG